MFVRISYIKYKLHILHNNQPSKTRKKNVNPLDFKINSTQLTMAGERE